MFVFSGNKYRQWLPISSHQTLILVLLLGVLVRLPVLLTPIQEGHRNAQTAALTAGMIENGRLRLDPIAPWRGDLDARLVMELPLYNLATLAINTLPGITLDMAGRVTSLVFWILSFIALQALWRRTLPPKATFWANLLFIFAPMNWYLSTAFMPESLLQLLAICFMICVLDYARKSSWGAFTGLVLTALFGLLVKFPGFVHLGLFLAFVLFDRGGWRAVLRPSLLASGLVIAAAVGSWGEYVKAVNAPHFADWSGWANLVGFIRPQAPRLSLGYYLPLLGFNVAFIVTLAGLPFVLWGTWRYLRTFRSCFVSRIWIYMLSSLVFSWLLWGKGAPSQSYYNLPNLVFACAAFGTGVTSVAYTLRRRALTPSSLRLAGAGLALLLLLLGLVGHLYLVRPDTVTFRAAAWVKANTRPTDLVIYQPRHSPSVIDYEHQPLLSHLSHRRCVIWTRGTSAWDKENALERGKFVIVTEPAVEPGFLERLRRKFRGQPSDPPPSIGQMYSLTTVAVLTDPPMTVYELPTNR